jgi:hypothetical protein
VRFVKRWIVVGAALATLFGGMGAVPASSAPSGSAETDQLQVYTGKVKQGDLGRIRSLGLDFEDIAASKPVDGKVAVEVVMTGRQAVELSRRGVTLEAKKINGKTAAQRLQAKAAKSGTVFRSYSEPGGIRDEIVQTAKDNPTLTKLVSVGRTVNGQTIFGIKVSLNAKTVADGKRPAVMYISAQHAREWITPEMTRRLMHYYIDSYATNPTIRQILNSTELWFVPVANPDGYDWTFTPGQRLWRKNLRDNNGDGKITTADGVDPNRNWPTKWGYDNEGSSADATSATYRGTGPASEPETRAMDAFFKKVKPKFLVNYHSAAELLLYGTGWQSATRTPDDIVYEALLGNDAKSAVPGYDPDLSAELYTTNGETTEHAQTARDILAITPEMSTCATVSDIDPNDQWNSGDCESVFNFPDDEKLIQDEFAKNIPLALSIAKSVRKIDEPKSIVGRTTPDFSVDKFTVSYGSPQTVAVTARRSLTTLRLNYRVGSGAAKVVPVQEWAGGKRYGAEGSLYYAEYRGTVRGAKPGDKVTVWFSGRKAGKGAVRSKPFTYTQKSNSGRSVLVVANEDYKGVNPTYPVGTDAPKYAKVYTTALAAAGVKSDVWDVDAQGAPHDLGVLSHYKAVVWYLGDNRLTQDQQDAVVTTPIGDLPDAQIADRAVRLTLSMRDYLNAGGRLLYTGETAGYYGTLGSALGGIYYGLGSDVTKPCEVTTDFFGNCALLSDDFSQYWLGTNSRITYDSPASFTGDSVLAGATGTFGGAATTANPLDEAGGFSPTSSVLPVRQFPQFRSFVTGGYAGKGGGNPYGPIEGDWYAGALHTDNAYYRLARTVDLSTTAGADKPSLGFQLSYDTEPGYDNVIVEAHTVGADDWTTLPETGGATSTDVPTECEAGFLLDTHPQLEKYLTRGTPCKNTGSTGAWNALTGSSNGWQPVSFDLSAYAGKKVEVSVSYVSDGGSGGIGIFVDDTKVTTSAGTVDSQGFETELAPWTTPGPPTGSTATGSDFTRSQTLLPVGAAVATNDSLTFGFGVEQIADPAEQAAVLKKAMKYLLR